MPGVKGYDKLLDMLSSNSTGENLPKKIDSSIRREFNLPAMPDARISFGDVAIGSAQPIEIAVLNI